MGMTARQEAERLIAAGKHVIALRPLTKAPACHNWPDRPLDELPAAGESFGIVLGASGLASVDLDDEIPAREGLKRLGIDFDALVRAGVRTLSTRPGSGGRITFAVPEGANLSRHVFRVGGRGVLELRAGRCQDAVPPITYAGADGEIYEQSYANGKRLTDAPPMPADLLELWQKCDADSGYFRQMQDVFDPEGVPARAAAQPAGKGQLPYPSAERLEFNGRHTVEEVLQAAGYVGGTGALGEGRFRPPGSASNAGVRPIPGKDGLWTSSHSTCPLGAFDCFDAWVAHVVLACEGDLAKAEEQAAAERFAALADEFEPVAEPGGIAANEPRFRLLNSADLRALPPLRWRVKGVLPATGLASIYGPSGGGKSFLAFDMAAAIAEGSPWFGRQVTPAPVVYLGLEGEAGFRQRARAWEQANGREMPLRMVLQPFLIDSKEDVAELARVVPDGAVVIVDTMNRAAPAADENSSADMGRIISGAKALQAAIDGLVVLIHHPGKDATRGMRGHSSLFAAMDAVIEVTRDGDRRAWSVSKSKDGQDGQEHGFRLSVEPVGVDEFGDALTSCVVTAEICALRHHTRRVRTSKAAGEILELLQTSNRALLQAEVANHFCNTYDKSTISRQLKALVKSGEIITDEELFAINPGVNRVA